MMIKIVSSAMLTARVFGSGYNTEGAGAPRNQPTRLRIPGAQADGGADVLPQQGRVRVRQPPRGDRLGAQARRAEERDRKSKGLFFMQALYGAMDEYAKFKQEFEGGETPKERPIREEVRIENDTLDWVPREKHEALPGLESLGGKFIIEGGGMELTGQWTSRADLPGLYAFQSGDEGYLVWGKHWQHCKILKFTNGVHEALASWSKVNVLTRDIDHEEINNKVDDDFWSTENTECFFCQDNEQSPQWTKAIWLGYKDGNGILEVDQEQILISQIQMCDIIDNNRIRRTIWTHTPPMLDASFGSSLLD